MEASQVYILISIVVLLIIAILIFFIKKNKKEKRLSLLAGIAFAFILVSIFVEDRLIGYSLIGIGVVIAIIDIIIKSKKK